jgi:hypothetical protein
MPEFKLAITTDRIVVADFGQFPVLTRELLEKAFGQRRKLVAGPCPVLVVIGGAFSATPAAHRFAAGSKYGELTSAVAMVGDYAVCKELFSLFAQLDKPDFPCRYFDKTDPALDWLRTFL